MTFFRFVLLQLPRYMGIETPILPVKRLAVLLQLPRYMGIEMLLLLLLLLLCLLQLPRYMGIETTHCIYSI